MIVQCAHCTCEDQGVVQYGIVRLPDVDLCLREPSDTVEVQYINGICAQFSVYGHTTLKIPVLVRSPKSSNVGRG